MEMNSLERIPIRRDGDVIYDIVLRDSFDGLGEEIAALGLSGRKFCIVTDTNVAPLYLESVRAAVADKASAVAEYVFPAGEGSKNLDTVRGLYEHLILEHFDRKDILIALGGGVVGDLCGFAAATYLRGVGFIQIPTTLLSQVDSSIGGKTGVDFDSYKNMVGAFHMPRLVYMNISVLKTLPAEQFTAGMVEVIKHGLIRDAGYFSWLMENHERILALDPEACRMMITGSCMIKREVVEIDPTEQNERATLNFGHTLGHAIEKLKCLTMLHGHCVALGALAAMEICRKRGLVSQADMDAYRRAMELYGIPSHVSGLRPEDVIRATKNDKKMEAGVIKFILLDGIGHAFIDRTVSEEEMKEALSVIM